jgi:hypothetical protein
MTHIVSRYREENTYVHPAEGGIWELRYHFEATVFEGTEEECDKFVSDQKETRYNNFEAYKQLGGDETVSSNYPEGYIPQGWSSGGTIVFKKEPADWPRYWDNSNDPYTYE